jgi:hypothetical protein
MTPERIRELERAERVLGALQAGGVDNWDGYDSALRAIRQQDEIEEILEEAIEEAITEMCEGVEEPAGRGCGFGVKSEYIERAGEVLMKALRAAIEAKESHKYE